MQKEALSRILFSNIILLLKILGSKPYTSNNILGTSFLISEAKTEWDRIKIEMLKNNLEFEIC
jgi:hypothetical protein